MDCPEQKSQRVVVLQTLEFEEAAADYLARAHPDCTNFVHERDDSWLGVRGILVGRW